MLLKKVLSFYFSKSIVGILEHLNKNECRKVPTTLFDWFILQKEWHLIKSLGKWHTVKTLYVCDIFF